MRISSFLDGFITCPGHTVHMFYSRSTPNYGAGQVVYPHPTFFTLDFYRAVFNFFSMQVRKNPDVKTPDRIKDREDDAKTYYICGSVWKSLHTQAKHKRNAKALLNALDGMTVDGMTAVKLGLPTRHVTMQNRGGLVFASSAYYELMNKIENRFYSTVCFT